MDAQTVRLRSLSAAGAGQAMAVQGAEGVCHVLHGYTARRASLSSAPVIAPWGYRDVYRGGTKRAEWDPRDRGVHEPLREMLARYMHGARPTN